MKITKIEVLNDGMSKHMSEALFDKIEKFAGYGFNKSHAVAYSILSYWTCWLKVYYPAEYFASQLSIVKEDKYPNIVKDARSCGIEVLPPDINYSTDKFEIKDDKTIVSPFSAVKGCSQTTALKIVKARQDHGFFREMAEFVEVARQKGSGINSRVVSNLDLVGAFSAIEIAQKRATDPDRRKDQIVLMPGLVIDAIKAHEATAMDKAKKIEILAVYNDVIECKDCDLSGKPHPAPVVGGAKCKFAVVFDCPSAEEEEKGKLMVGKTGTLLKASMKIAEVSPSLGYYTTLVKAKKTDKFLSNAQINGCTKHVDRELGLVKPSVVVCMGSASVKHFLPDIKSPSAEIGNSYYSKELDATVVIGFNPLQIVFDPNKAEKLDNVFKKVAECLCDD